MKPEYDFKKAKRGAVVPVPKGNQTRITPDERWAIRGLEQDDKAPEGRHTINR